MSTTDDVRAALKGGPMKASEIADHLGVTEAEDRNKLYTAIRQMANLGRGVEQLDDGKYSLVPGWKPTRGAGAKAEKPARTPRAAKAPKAAKRGKPRKAAKAASAPRKPAPKPAAAATGGPVVQADPIATVTVPLAAVRALVSHAMRGTQPLDAPTRQAVLDVVKEAA